jgi:hypothetical protein
VRVEGGARDAQVAAVPRSVAIVPSAEFLQAHVPPAGLAATRTMLGYNPMLSDYGNTQFLVASASAVQ